jgi:NADH-ubiquinone oxidoreductase chain 1
MTEHAAVIFVFFFLAEYASILLMCIFNSILFLGGYLFNFTYFFYFLYYTYIIYDNTVTLNYFSESLFFGIILALKTCIFVFSFIWVRASLPRIRFDQLMSYC